MKRATAISLIVAGALVLTGAGLFLGSLSSVSWDFDALQTQQYEPVTHKVEGDFSDISIRTSESSITFKLSADGNCRVECMESENITYSVSVQEGALVITAVDAREWYHHIGILNTQRQNMTVYLPVAVYNSLQIKTQTGAVTVPSDFTFADVRLALDTGAVKWDAQVLHSMHVENNTGWVQIKNVHMDGELTVETDTGRAELCDVQAGSIRVNTDTGKAIVTDTVAKGELRVNTSTGNAELNGSNAADIWVETTTGKAKLTDVVATGMMDIDTDTGDVELDGCDAAEIKIETDTGDVRGTLLTPKIIFTETDTGRVEVPRSTTGGICEITTDTGDIRIAFK